MFGSRGIDVSAVLYQLSRQANMELVIKCVDDKKFTYLNSGVKQWTVNDPCGYERPT